MSDLIRTSGDCFFCGEPCDTRPDDTHFMHPACVREYELEQEARSVSDATGSTEGYK